MRCTANAAIASRLPSVRPVRRDAEVRPLHTPHMSDTYGDQLRSIASILQCAGFSPSVRGDGGCRFVYAEHADRAVELYWDGAGFLVELFEQPSETSVRDYQQDTPEHAAEQAVEWLSRHENAA